MPASSVCPHPEKCNTILSLFSPSGQLCFSDRTITVLLVSSYSPDWPQPRTGRRFIPEFTICLVQMWPWCVTTFIQPYQILYCCSSVEWGGGTWQGTNFPWVVMFCVNVCLVNNIPDVICCERIAFAAVRLFCNLESWEANDYLSSWLQGGGHTSHVWANRCGLAKMNHFKGAVKKARLMFKILTLLKAT